MTRYKESKDDVGWRQRLMLVACCNTLVGRQQLSGPQIANYFLYGENADRRTNATFVPLTYIHLRSKAKMTTEEASAPDNKDDMASDDHDGDVDTDSQGTDDESETESDTDDNR